MCLRSHVAEQIIKGVAIAMERMAGRKDFGDAPVANRIDPLAAKQSNRDQPVCPDKEPSLTFELRSQLRPFVQQKLASSRARQEFPDDPGRSILVIVIRVPRRARLPGSPSVGPVQRGGSAAITNEVVTQLVNAIEFVLFDLFVPACKLL